MKRIFVFLMAVVFSLALVTASQANANVRGGGMDKVASFIESVHSKNYVAVMYKTNGIDTGVIKELFDSCTAEEISKWNMETLDMAYDLQELLTVWKTVFDWAVKTAIHDGTDYETIFRLQQAKYRFAYYEREWARLLQ